MPMTLRERSEHIYFAERDLSYRKDFLSLCAKDPVFACNTLGWTFDPRLDSENRYLPFLLFPQQEEVMRGWHECRQQGKDNLTEKSRDTGASWGKLFHVWHGWYFEEGYSCLLGSRKEDMVDKPNEPACLMWKIDMIHKCLPDWMKIPGYDPANKSCRSHLMMFNPVKQSTITGESANPNFGRQGRYTEVVSDEAAFWPNLRASYTSSGESTKSRCLISTPNGMNLFGKLANPKKAKKGERQSGPRKFRLHWSLDPRHVVMTRDEDPDSATFGKMINAWLEEQRLRYAYDPELMAQELDIDYRSSVKGRYYPQIDFSGIGTYAYDPLLPLYSAWDFGAGDDTAILWLQFDSTTLRYRIIDAYANRGKSIEWYAPFITGILPGDPNGETYQKRDLEIIGRHRGWRHTAHFGDPSGNNTTQTTMTSVIDELAMLKIYITCNYKENTNIQRRRATQRLLLRCDIDEEMCEDFIDAIRNSKFPEKAEGHQDTSPNTKPVHDEFSHYRTALEYFAVNNPHRHDTEDRREGNRARGRTVGAVFGDKDLYARLSQDMDNWEAYAEFEEDFMSGVSIAGY